MRSIKNQPITKGRIVFSGLLMLGILSTIYAERGRVQINAADTIAQSGTLRTAPTSKAKVTVRITFDTGVVFTVTQLEGATIRVGKHESTVGIIAHIDSERSDRVSADVFSLIPIESQGAASSGEHMADLTSLEIGREASEVVKGGLRFKVELLETLKAPNAVPSKASFSRLTPQAGGICCITCPGGEKACGCLVESSCGSCCCDPCCPGGGFAT